MLGFARCEQRLDCARWRPKTRLVSNRQLERYQVSNESPKADTRDIVAELAQEAEAQRRRLLGKVQDSTKRNVLNYSATAVGAPGEIMMTPEIVNLTRVMSKEKSVRRLSSPSENWKQARGEAESASTE